MDKQEILKQIRSNTVAIITLIMAATSLGYNTWRNEKTEENRTTRVAAFEVLKSLGELQVIVNYSFYGGDNNKSDPMLGWGYVSLIGDLSQVLNRSITKETDRLLTVWKANWHDLKTSEESADKITEQIDNVRTAVRNELHNLR
jgi:hypothetical protein